MRSIKGVLKKLGRILLEVLALGIVIGGAWWLLLQKKQAEVKALKTPAPVQVYEQRRDGVTYLVFIGPQSMQVRNFSLDSLQIKRGY